MSAHLPNEPCFACGHHWELHRDAPFVQDVAPVPDGGRCHYNHPHSHAGTCPCPKFAAVPLPSTDGGDRG